MSTRCLYGFTKDGDFKLAYNHDDSYPRGFGKMVVLFIRENTLEQLNEICDKIKLVKWNDLPNDDEIAEMIKKDIYYRRNGQILCWNDIFLCNDTFLDYYKKDFYVMADCSDCLDGLQDYLYLINLDENTFEVYEMRLSNEKIESDSKLKKYKLAKSFDLENIPRDWDMHLV